MAERALVLIVASGAAWEPAALRLLGEHPGVVVLRRCVDVDDLLAAATAGQADVAVLGLDAPGLDRAAVDLLRKHGVRPVAIAPGGASLDGGRLRAARIGIPRVVTEDELDSLPEAVLAAEPPVTAVRPGPPAGPPPLGPPPLGPAPVGPPPAGPPAPLVSGRVVAVWGPAGRPADDRRDRARGRVGPAGPAYAPRRRRSVWRQRGPAARHPRRGLGAALRGPAGGRRAARGAVRLCAAWPGPAAERGHRAASRRPLGRGARGCRRAPAGGGS